MSDDTGEDIYKKYHKKAKSHKYLYHYTTIDALLSIITNKEIRLSNLFLLNDPLEYERLFNEPMLQNRIFVCCFNHIIEDAIPLWKMYADGSYGIRIGFPIKSVQFFENLSNYRCGPFIFNENPNRTWKFGYSSVVDVIYDDDFSRFITSFDAHHSPDVDKIQIPIAIGHLKKKCWEYEKETRICVGVKPDDLGVCLDKKSASFVYAAPPFKYIYCRIPDVALLDMKVMFSPKCNALLKEMMENEIRRQIPGFKDENFQKSDIIIGGC
jgi:hypothetical protein